MKYDNVEIDKIKGVMYKDHLLINYRNERLNIQTNWITLSHYGVPKSDKYHTTEESRRYLQIPLFPDDNFTKFIQSLDNHFSSDNFKKQFLEEKQQIFNYIPILKEGKADYPASMKIKIDFYNDKYLSEVYHKTDDKGNVKCDLNTMNDIKRCIPYKSEIKIIFRINKLWFMSENYGVQLKMVKVLIKNIQNKEIENIDFL
jgi:hypothetical protein